MTPTKFEDRLLAELRAVVAARPTPAPVTSTPVRRTAGARLILATGAVAATVAGVVVASGGESAAPAYAVAKQSDGSVTVEINSLRDAAGLQEKLRAAGIPAIVDYTPIGKACREPRGRPATARRPMMVGVRESGRVGGGASHSTTFTITRDGVPSGDTLVITSSVGSSVTSLGTEVVEGPVAPCQLVDAPLPPAGPPSGPPSAGGSPSGGFSTGGSKSGSTDAGPSTQTAP